MLPARDILTDDEKVVDPQLGYPRGYANLCRQAHIQMQGLITPFTEGPPQRFLPYVPLDEELANARKFDALFPTTEDAERDPSDPKQYEGILWEQLDHLGNAGFDPSKFRVDAYGNVLYFHADPGSPLAWEIDHWFPHSRGGKTVPSNLRIVQWQVRHSKSSRLEFLVPWWDLQLGVSVSQFLCVFSSNNLDFRHRAFALFFMNGEKEQIADENVSAECHAWSQSSRECMVNVGLAAASIVRIQKRMHDSPKFCGIVSPLKEINQVSEGGVARRRLQISEEDVLKRAPTNSEYGKATNTRDRGTRLDYQSRLQHHLTDESDKENREQKLFDYQSMARQTDDRIIPSRMKERMQREQCFLQLEVEHQKLKYQNEKEKALLDELEKSLANQRRRVEKQRRWCKAQSEYRDCLDKMMKDTLHQCVLYKEQARLNQAACNALVARLESQRSVCASAEMDMITRIKHRESLEALARATITKRTRNEGHTDVGACIKLKPDPGSDGVYGRKQGSTSRGIHGEKNRFRRSRMRGKQMNSENQEQGSPRLGGCAFRERTLDMSLLDEHGNMQLIKDVPALMKGSEQTLPSTEEPDGNALDDNGDCRLPNGSSQDEEGNGDNQMANEQPVSATQLYENGTMKRKAVGWNDLDLDKLKVDSGLASGAREGDLFYDGNYFANIKFQGRKTRDDQQLDELFQKVMEMKGKVAAAMADAIEDEDNHDQARQMAELRGGKSLQSPLVDEQLNGTGNEVEKGGSMGKFTRGIAQLASNLSQQKVKADDSGKDCKVEERRMIEGFTRLRVGNGDANRAPDSDRLTKKSEDDGHAQRAYEALSVQTMNTSREREQRRRSITSTGTRPRLHQLLDDSNPERFHADQETKHVAGSVTPSRSSTVGARCDAELRRWSMGAHMQVQLAKKQSQQSACNTSQLQLAQHNMGALYSKQEVESNSPQRPQQDHQHPSRTPLHQIERSSSTPPAGALLTPISVASHKDHTEEMRSKSRQSLQGRPHLEERCERRHSLVPRQQRTDDNLSDRNPSVCRRSPQLSRQLTAGHAIGGGGAARKASMLMKSASTRASMSSSSGSPSRSSSGGSAARRVGEGEAEVASMRRKASLFQDWDVNENLRASLSHVWKKAVRKFDLTRQPQPSQRSQASHKHRPSS
ncbi:hypothetical protein KP509_14G001300 [Ceratopteris richardii]|uniref:Uncharacterized protein n=1 Tax=Ceratopteris richardii TaxID=49495 RepID=A0A8T2T6J4_CERRI|nr:hypothetical protein KP509_14G001300 [Ceratopteris richardii]